MRVFRADWGPLLIYREGILSIRDLNPEHIINWQLTRLEMFRLGCKAILASIFG